MLAPTKNTHFRGPRSPASGLEQSGALVVDGGFQLKFTFKLNYVLSGSLLSHKLFDSHSPLLPAIREAGSCRMHGVADSCHCQYHLGITVGEVQGHQWPTLDSLVHRSYALVRRQGVAPTLVGPVRAPIVTTRALSSYCHLLL